MQEELKATKRISNIKKRTNNLSKGICLQRALIAFSNIIFLFFQMNFLLDVSVPKKDLRQYFLKWQLIG